MADTVVVQTALGRVTVVWREGRGVEIRFEGPGPETEEGAPRVVEGKAPDAAGEDLVRSLLAYFSGAPGTPGRDLPLPEGTPFQRAVWRAAREIPHGETRSYGQLAAQIGRPKAARAVGAALGQNPLPLVVPCHRVVGSNGALTGFAGGKDWKAGLLALERNEFRFGRKAG